MDARNNDRRAEILEVRRASREIVRELGLLQQTFVAGGLTLSQCHALMEIGDHTGLDQRALAEILRLDTSTTSRVVERLAARGWVRGRRDPADGRRRLLELTTRGRTRVAQLHDGANARVQAALAVLDGDGRALVREGLARYATALARARVRATLDIRPIRRADNPAIARIIRTVLAEFGGIGPGFASADAEVDDIWSAYRAPRAHYWVVTREDVVIGGGGYGPLAGGDERTCELRKMYVLRDGRGVGIGDALLTRAMEHARAAGYRRMYLETLKSMTAARRLYERHGFRPSPPLGNTGHFGCDAWYHREL
jgi:putative acetyltransferase